jgi:hypothetical protein
LKHAILMAVAQMAPGSIAPLLPRQSIVVD